MHRLEGVAPEQAVCTLQWRDRYTDTEIWPVECRASRPCDTIEPPRLTMDPERLTMELLRLATALWRPNKLWWLGEDEDAPPLLCGDPNTCPMSNDKPSEPRPVCNGVLDPGGGSAGTCGTADLCVLGTEMGLGGLTPRGWSDHATLLRFLMLRLLFSALRGVEETDRRGRPLVPPPDIEPELPAPALVRDMAPLRRGGTLRSCHHHRGAASTW